MLQFQTLGAQEEPERDFGDLGEGLVVRGCKIPLAWQLRWHKASTIILLTQRMQFPLHHANTYVNTLVQQVYRFILVPA